MVPEYIRHLFNKANDYAKSHTTCMKIGVGSIIMDNKSSKILSIGSNFGSHNCVEHGECYKAALTGIYESREETRKYCKSIHSEINALNKLDENKLSDDCTIFVTRYPCEDCSKAIIKSGIIKGVCYCGKVKISENSEKLFKESNISVDHYPEIDFEY